MSRGTTVGRVIWGELPAPARVVRIATMVVALVAAFTVALTAVYAIPQGRILENLRASGEQLTREGLYPRPMLDARSYQIDNFSDAIMLDTAIATSGRGPFLAAMETAHGSADPIAALVQSAAGRRVPNPYPYYWHGYVLFLRPLLIVFDYGRIRFVNLVALGLLTMVTLHAVRTVAGRKASGALALSLLAAGFFLVPFCLQFSSMTYLMLLGCLGVLGLSRVGRLASLDLELFCAIGSLAAFLDLLSTPLMTLGLPLALLLAMGSHPRLRPGVLARARYVVATGAVWLIGYATTWVAKWALGTVATGTNVFRMALSQVLFRTGLERGPQRIGEALVKNVTNLLPLLRSSDVAGGVSANAVAVAATLGLVAVAVAWAIRRFGAGRERVRAAASVLLVVPLPYLWMVAANNHSAIHNWFTYRMQVFAVFAVVFFLVSCIDVPALLQQLSPRAARAAHAAHEGSGAR